MQAIDLTRDAPLLNTWAATASSSSSTTGNQGTCMILKPLMTFYNYCRQ